MVRVSIIIPMKNVETFIGRCLLSILNNSYPRDQYEIICIDNGSTDNTVKIAKKYTSQIFKIPNGSISHVRNVGAQKAKGDFLAFIDSDCIADKQWLKNASIYFDEKKIVCFGSTPGIPQDATWVEETWFLNKAMRARVQEVDWLESMNLFVRKDLFHSLGGFNEDLITCEDVDLCYRIKKENTIISDRRIKVIHLGEAKTVKEFFLKELWRGTSNLKGVLDHGLTIKELPSILLPIYYLLSPLFFFSFLKPPSWLGSFFGQDSLLPPPF